MDQMQKKPIWKKFWWVGIVLAVVVLSAIGASNSESAPEEAAVVAEYEAAI